MTPIACLWILRRNWKSRQIRAHLGSIRNLLRRAGNRLICFSRNRQGQERCSTSTNRKTCSVQSWAATANPKLTMDQHHSRVPSSAPWRAVEKEQQLKRIDTRMPKVHQLCIHWALWVQPTSIRSSLSVLWSSLEMKSHLRRLYAVWLRREIINGLINGKQECNRYWTQDSAMAKSKFIRLTTGPIQTIYP